MTWIAPEALDTLKAQTLARLKMLKAKAPETAKRVVVQYKRPLAALAIFFLGIVGFNYLVATKPQVESQPRSEEVRKVATITAERVDAAPTQKAFGVVAAARIADLRFAIGGEVAVVNDAMRSGEIVEQGQVLAYLDTQLLSLAVNDIAVQLESEEANQIELAKQFALRERQFERVRQMRAASVASEKRLDDAELALSISKNALQQSESRVEQLKIAKQRAARNLDDAVLEAPFNGILADINIGQGQVVNSNHVLGSITDMNSLEVSFIVPAEIYTTSAELMGRPVQITWTAGGRDVITVEGLIDRAEGNVQADEGGGRLYASLPPVGPPVGVPVDLQGNGEVRSALPERPALPALPLVPAGAFVEITYPSSPLEDVIILPESAIFDRSFVFVVIEGRAERRPVEVLSKADGQVYIRGSIADGAEVITTRTPGLAQGTLVEVLGGKVLGGGGS